jgi:hypothetical protein
MKKFQLRLLWSAAALLLMAAAPLNAQEIACNGDFELNDWEPMWTLTGGNAHTQIAMFQTVIGVNSLCLKRRPGTPNDNGGIAQTVHLMEGVVYHFGADIAAVESG